MKFEFTTQTQQGPIVVHVEGDSLQDVYARIDELGYNCSAITLIEEDV